MSLRISDRRFIVRRAVASGWKSEGEFLTRPEAESFRDQILGDDPEAHLKIESRKGRICRPEVPRQMPGMRRKDGTIEPPLAR